MNESSAIEYSPRGRIMSERTYTIPNDGHLSRSDHSKS